MGMSEAHGKYLSLAAEFAAVDQTQWCTLVEAALKGASFARRLASQTYDGLSVQPLYPRAMGATALAGRPAIPWQIIQRTDHPDPAAANVQALHDLENGATGLALIFAGAPASRGYGVSIGSVDDLDRSLANVMLEMISLRLETAPFSGRPISMLMTELVARRRLDPAEAKIDFGLDPIGDMARTGQSILPWPELSERAGLFAKDLHAKGFCKARLLRADGRAIHDGGGSEAQELAFVLAAGVAYLRLLEASGFTLDEARGRISFMLTADADEFLTIAKFRALRKLWARVEEASGLVPQPAFVAAETAWRMMTARDVYVNMLRTSIAVTAAGLGGADSITVLPFTNALGLPDRFARRVGRNTQLILLEEAHLAKVADPAAGSGGIEALTSDLAQVAWTLFQEIETAGGAAAALEQGFIQNKIAGTHASREANVARRKDALTGVSDYAYLNELPVKVLDVARISAPSVPAQVTFESLPSIRLTESFEALRDKSDAILAKTGSRPKVFLANLGKPSDFTARASFAKNFYEAGGIEAVNNDGFLTSPLPERERAIAYGTAPLPPPPLAGEGRGGGGLRIVKKSYPSPERLQRSDPLLSGEGSTDVAAMLAAFKVSGAKLACICSSDKIYETEAAKAAKALTAAGAIVHLAGQPGKHEQKWRQAGVKDFIFAGCDVLSTLLAAHDNLGIK